MEAFRIVIDSYGVDVFPYEEQEQTSRAQGWARGFPMTLHSYPYAGWEQEQEQEDSTVHELDP